MPADATDDRGRSYWERHARRYDRSTRFLSRPVPRMLELAVEAARGKTRVLEVAAGTGLVTTAIAPAVGELIASDYAAEMVKQLEARVRDAGLANVRCEQADLYRLRFDDASLDAVFAANVRWLSRYRHPRCAGRPGSGLDAGLLRTFAMDTPLLAGAEATGDRLQVLPVLFHLMWQGRLVASEFTSAPLGAATGASAGFIVSVSFWMSDGRSAGGSTGCRPGERLCWCAMGVEAEQVNCVNGEVWSW